MSGSSSFDTWIAALDRRHLGELKFSEVRKGLQALSSVYVERRERLASGRALDGSGKRAAFALFYGPVHFLLVREIVRSLGADLGQPRQILDLGCGTGAPAAAWALECLRPPRIEGVDVSGYAVDEALWTWSKLALRGSARRMNIANLRPPPEADGILAAFVVNELSEAEERQLLTSLLTAAEKGSSVLVVEPISRRTTPWWPRWQAAFERRDGRSDEWRFPAHLPETQSLLARAAGLDARELLGRTLSLNPDDARSSRPRSRARPGPPSAPPRT